jgi:hypothetical protein
MIIENKDWRWSENSSIEVWWEGTWLTTAQIAWRTPDANFASTIENRFRRAIGGDLKYAKYSVNDLIYMKAGGRKNLIVNRITRCPKTAALLHFWAGAFEYFPFKLWLVAISEPTCDKKLYAKGLCKYCHQIVEGHGTSTLSVEAKAAISERETSPERRRAKTLTARRRLLIPILLDLQPEPLSLLAVKMIIQHRYDDLDDGEMAKFVTLAYDAYEAKWLALRVEDADAVRELFRIKKETVNAAAFERIRKALDAMLKTGKAAAKK